MKILILILTLIQIKQVISQYVFSDLICIGEIELVSYSNPLNQNQSVQYSEKKTVQFPDKKFTKVPKIIIGYSYLDYDYQSNTKSFEIVYDNAKIDSFQIQFIKYSDTKVYRVVAVYVAIDSDDVYYNQILFNFDPWPQNNSITQSKPFMRPDIDKNLIKVKAIGFLTSLKQFGTKYVQRHKISVKVNVSEQNIDIVAKQDDPDQDLAEINVNYIEYYVKIKNPYYDLEVIEDTMYLQSIQRTANSYSTSFPLDYSNNNDVQGIITGLNKFDIPLNSHSGRMDILNKIYNSETKQYSFNYRIWEDSEAYMFSATIGAFKMIDCSKQSPQTPINNSFTQSCVSQCPDGYTKYNQLPMSYSQCQLNPCSIKDCQLCDQEKFCIQCIEGYYLYNQQCYSTKPSKTYCDLKLVCSNCKDECETCGDSTSCLSCNNGYFYEAQCYQKKPNNTYCDSDKICKICKNFNCVNCDDKLQDCINCNNQYFYDKTCYKSVPDNTYCDEQKICFRCNELCMQCRGPKNNDCTVCDTKYYNLNNNKCECKSSQQGYNSSLGLCSSCSIPLCTDCYGNYLQCQACSSNSVLNNGKCECKDPKQYFDQYYQKCLTTTVQNCKISVKTKNECQECNDGYFHDASNDKCVLCSNQMYADIQNKCILKCKANCLSCVNESACIQENNQTDDSNKTDNKDTNQVQNCHFSCDQCTESKNPFSCQTCSSDTRQYNSQTKQCECKSGYREVEQKICQQISDLDESIGKTFIITSYISLGVQSLFIFVLNSPHFQYIVILQQQIYLFTYYSQLNSDLNFYKYLEIFRHYSLFSLFENVKVFSNASDALNNLIIYTSVIVVSILIAFAFHFIGFSYSQSSYFRWNLVFLIQRLISLFSYELIFQLLLQYQQYSNTFTIIVVSGFILFNFIATGLHINGIHKQRKSCQMIQLNRSDTLGVSSDNSQNPMHLKMPLDNSMEKSQNTPNNNHQNQEIETISTFQQRKSTVKSSFISPYNVLFSQLNQEGTIYQYFWLLIEFRKMVCGFLIGYFANYVWVFYIITGISLIFAILIQFNYILNDPKKRKLVLFTECMIICVQVFFSFYINQLEEDSQNKILILLISCCIFLISVTQIIFHLSIIFEYFKVQLDINDPSNQSQQQQNQPKNNMRMQAYFTSDQINAVLDQNILNISKNPRSKRRYY